MSLVWCPSPTRRMIRSLTQAVGEHLHSYVIKSLKAKTYAFNILIDIIKLSFKHIAATYTFTDNTCECPFLHVLASTGLYQILIFANLIIYRFNLVLH